VDDELLNVYDPRGRVIGASPRHGARAAGQAVGAVNALVINGRREVLLQQRLRGKENGGLWDKTVGGHVSAGEDFDRCMVREAGEELFGDGQCGRIRLASPSRFAAVVARGGARSGVVLHSVDLQLNLRDVRHVPGGRFRNVLYHVGIYLGRTDLPRRAFRPDRAELADLRYFTFQRVDRMLLDGELAPNMAFVWLAHAQALRSLVQPRRSVAAGARAP
jgi:8-oxo-dGTP pyrophosphatase MutT (NUDIX family)